MSKAEDFEELRDSLKRMRAMYAARRDREHPRSAEHSMAAAPVFALDLAILEVERIGNLRADSAKVCIFPSHRKAK